MSIAMNKKVMKALKKQGVIRSYYETSEGIAVELGSELLVDIYKMSNGDLEVVHGYDYNNEKRTIVSSNGELYDTLCELNQLNPEESKEYIFV